MSHTFSAQDFQDLVDNVDFSEPLQEGDSSFLTQCDDKCGLTPFSTRDDCTILYHKFLEKGCKKCDTCHTISKNFNFSKNHSVDFTRPIPGCLDSVRNNIVSSLSDHFDLWCAQPRDEYEQEQYDYQSSEATYFHSFELEYWDWVQYEINYLKTWEEVNNISRKRKQHFE